MENIEAEMPIAQQVHILVNRHRHKIPIRKLRTSLQGRSISAGHIC